MGPPKTMLLLLQSEAEIEDRGKQQGARMSLSLGVLEVGGGRVGYR